MPSNTRTLPPPSASYPRTNTQLRPAAPVGNPGDGSTTISDDATQPDPRLVFAKTLAGTDAIRHPSKRVSLAARRLLLLFDGQRSLAQLPNIVRPNEVPTLLQELESLGMITLTGMARGDDSTSTVHPDVKMAQIKRSLAGVFEKELGLQASVLEARVQDCMNLVVLRNVLREVIALVAQRKDGDAADRIALVVKKHGPF